MLSSFNPNTATGPDELLAIILKKRANEIAPNILHIRNFLISLGIVPDLKKKLIFQPFGKAMAQGEILVIIVQFPFSLLARMMEKEIGRQLSNYCDGKVIILPQKFGF